MLHSAIRSRFPPLNSFIFLSEWLLLVIPLLLSMTLFAERPGTLSAALLLPAVTIYIFFPPHQSGTPLPFGGVASPRVSPAPHPAPGSDDKTPQQRTTSTEVSETTRLSALSTYRAHMILVTVLAILAVDFPVFPRALAKCETYGVSFVRPVFLLDRTCDLS
jgi:phosphatidylinositol glycan class W